MAVGGTWQSQNKVRPGAYINFVGTPKSLSSVGARGIIAAPLSLSWGAQIIEMVANDLVTGASLEKAGVLFTDDAALNLRLLLQSCSKAVIYRLNAETATKATKTAGGLKFTAKHGGTFGNKIAVDIAVKTESGGEGGGGGGAPTKAHGQFPVLSIEAASVGVDGDEIYVTFQKSNPDYGDSYIDFSAYDKNGNLYVTSSGGNLRTDEPITAEKLNAFHDDGNNPITNYMTFSGVLDPASVPEYDEDPLIIHLSGGSASAKATALFAKFPADLIVEAANTGEAGNNLRLEIYQTSNGVNVDIYDSGSDDPETPVFTSYNEIISSEWGIYIGDSTFNTFVDNNDSSVVITQYVVATGGITVTSDNDAENPLKIQLSGGSEGGSGGGSDVVGVTVKTYVNGSLKATGKCAETETVADELGNDWVDVEGNFEGVEAGRYALEGGADGEEVTDISAALDVFENYKFNILAIPQTGSTTKAQAVQWVEGMRKDKGVKVQCVLSEYAGDSEAVISTWQGYTLEDGTAISKAQTVLAVASMEAGAAITESLTGAVIPGAIAVADAPTKHDDIVEALEAGKLILSRRDDGMIVIEKDQNTLHTFTPTHGYIFSKNRPLRVLDQIGNDIKGLFNKNFLGKVGNDDEGREIFKNDLVAYFRQLEGMGAIQNFRPDDVLVLPGNDSDSVVVQLYVQPVDSMEKLYLTVFVEG